MKKFSPLYIILCSFYSLQVGIAFVLVIRQSKVIPAVLSPFLSLYFLVYLKQLMKERSQLSLSEPLWVLRKIGFGLGLNPRHPVGYWLSFGLSLTIFLALVYLTFCLFFFT